MFENGLIPWTAIKDYAHEYDIAGEQKELLFETIRGVDAWYMDRVAIQTKKANKKGKGKSSGKGNGL